MSRFRSGNRRRSGRTPSGTSETTPPRVSIASIKVRCSRGYTTSTPHPSTATVRPPRRSTPACAARSMPRARPLITTTPTPPSTSANPPAYIEPICRWTASPHDRDCRLRGTVPRPPQIQDWRRVPQIPEPRRVPGVEPRHDPRTDRARPPQFLSGIERRSLSNNPRREPGADPRNRSQVSFSGMRDVPRRAHHLYETRDAHGTERRDQVQRDQPSTLVWIDTSSIPVSRRFYTWPPRIVK